MPSEDSVEGEEAEIVRFFLAASDSSQSKAPSLPIRWVVTGGDWLRGRASWPRFFSVAPCRQRQGDFPFCFSRVPWVEGAPTLSLYVGDVEFGHLGPVPSSFWFDLCADWRRQWHPTPVLLPGKSHGWRSLVGYSPRGCKELDTTERLYFTLYRWLLPWTHWTTASPILITGSPGPRRPWAALCRTSCWCVWGWGWAAGASTSLFFSNSQAGAGGQGLVS